MTRILILSLLFLLLCGFAGRGRFGPDLRNHIVAQYKMNDNADSNAVIDSMESYDGNSVRDTCDMTTTGKIGGALSFNGTSDVITFNPSGFPSGSSARSLSVWVYMATEDFSDAEAICYYGDTDQTNGFGLAYYDMGKMKILSTIETDVDIVLDEWVNWIVTYDGTNLKLYKNSVLVFTSDPITLATLTNLGQIGKTGVSYPFNGSLDSVIIFDKALTQNEINYIYNGGKGREAIKKNFRHRRLEQQ